MAKTGSTQKHKVAQITAAQLHAKWSELDHIVSELNTAAHSAHYPYVARTGRITPAMQASIDRYIVWCMRHYGEKA